MVGRTGLFWVSVLVVVFLMLGGLPVPLHNVWDDLRGCWCGVRNDSQISMGVHAQIWRDGHPRLVVVGMILAVAGMFLAFGWLFRKKA